MSVAEQLVRFVGFCVTEAMVERNKLECNKLLLVSSIEGFLRYEITDIGLFLIYTTFLCLNTT